MKKRIYVNSLNYYLFGLSCVIFGFFLSGLLLNIRPVNVLFILVKYKWVFFALTIIVGIKPWWTAIFGERSAEGLPEKKEIKKSKNSKTEKKKFSKGQKKNESKK
jgi:hypothetical protein